MLRTRIALLGEVWIGPPGDLHPEQNQAFDLLLRPKLLIASLAVTRTAISRDELIRRFWPDAITRGTEDGNLNNGVSDARKPLCSPDALVSVRPDRALRLDRQGTDERTKEEFLVETDIDELKQYLDADTADDAKRALALVRGRLLHGVSHPWLDEERARLDRLIVRGIRRVTHWPLERATLALEDFYVAPSGTLDAYISAIRADDDDQQPATSDPHAAIYSGLTALYPGAAKLDTLRELIVPHKPIYRDMSVRFFLRDSSEPDNYTLKYQIEYHTPLDEFVVALTTRATLGDLLIAECPRISDAFAFSDDEARKAFVETGIQLTHYAPLPSGRTAKHDCKFRPVARTRRSLYLGDIEPSLAADVVLYAASIPGTHHERHLELTITSERMSRHEHYCFWIADRPSYVRRITLDFSRFTLHDRDRPHLHPFLGTVSHEIKDSDGAYDILLENWLVKDQGVMLIW
jgi:hypothetical protein